MSYRNSKYYRDKPVGFAPKTTTSYNSSRAKSSTGSKYSSGLYSSYSRNSGLFSSASRHTRDSSPRRRMTLTDHSSTRRTSSTRDVPSRTSLASTSSSRYSSRNTLQPPYRRTSTREVRSTTTSSRASRKDSDKDSDSSDSPKAQKSAKTLICDKCDGKHETSKCPYYKKKRENHPDAQRRKVKDLGKGGKRVIVRSGRVVRQPGDGSCLFHSMAYGLGGTSGRRLRSEICNYMRNHPNADIAGNPLKDWVKWDANQSVDRYARAMSGSRWGGGIEMAVCAKMKGVNIHVYERRGWFSGGYERISCFETPGARRTISVLYCGGIHYDAFIP